MSVRQSAKNGSRKDRGRRASDQPPAAASAADQLDYIADMVEELKAMSAQANCQALTELLELAHREARQRRRAG